jgi:hypothetical protein
MSDFDSVNTAWSSRHEAQAKINAHNKEAVFDALSASNITEVLVDFDGYGDDGQIGAMTAFD